MKQLTVAGCRIPVGMSIDQNVVQIKRAIDWAAVNGVNIMVTPECALSGYMWAPDDRQDPRIQELAEALGAVQEYSLLKAVDLVLGTACYNAQGAWANMQAFIVDGHCVDHYEKQVLFGAEQCQMFELNKSTSPFFPIALIHSFSKKSSVGFDSILCE